MRQALVWKEVNYGQMSEKEKQLIVSEVHNLCCMPNAQQQGL